MAIDNDTPVTPGEQQPQTQPQTQQQSETNPTHEDPIRLAVERAYEKSEAESSGEESEEHEEREEARLEPGTARDPKTGQFIKQTAKPAPKPMPAVQAKPAAPAPAVGKPVPPVKAEEEGKEGEEEEAAAAPVADRAPQSWKATAKVHWKNLPAPVKADVLRREREHEALMREAAPARKTADALAETIRPFEGFIRAAGHTPMQSIAELMKTAAALRTLPAREKAMLVAGIVRAHDVNPEDLYAALMSEGPLPSAPAPQQAQFRDPRVDELLESVNAERAAAVERANAEADRELDAFIAAHPLAGDADVQTRMARAIALAEQDGVDISYEEAYDGVLAVDAELRALAQQQDAAQAANPEARRSTPAQAEAAAASIRPSPVTGAPPPLKGRSVEDHVRAAFDKASRRV